MEMTLTISIWLKTVKKFLIELKVRKSQKNWLVLILSKKTKEIFATFYRTYMYKLRQKGKYFVCFLVDMRTKLFVFEIFWPVVKAVSK